MPRPQVAAPPATVHLVCKTHLDVGFTALAAEVLDRYVEVFIPSALEVASELRKRGGAERFVWTTGSWLIDTFLERSDAAGRRAMEAGVVAGDIAWHALPFTLHSELCDASLFEHVLSIAARLDARFGRRTIAAKATDVPGHTRGVVPLLAAAGVEFLHIGVNPACPAPDLPGLFRWRGPDGAEVVVAYQQGGYGGTVTVPGRPDALVVAHTDDNAGPQTVAQVLATFGRVRHDHPGATVVASTLDAFARALRPAVEDLPVVLDEVGDTWIHGVGTDPVKVGRFRAACRARTAGLADGSIVATDPVVSAASDDLLLVAEHTWGLDEKLVVVDNRGYGAADLARLRAEPAGARFESSWAEQRRYVDDAVARLTTTSIGRGLIDELAELEPRPVDRAGLHDIALDRIVEVGPVLVSVDGSSGALVALRSSEGGRDLADPSHPLGVFAYQSFDGADYDRFHFGYNRASAEDEWWALLDYTKPGIDECGAVSRRWEPSAVAAAAGQDRLVVTLTMPAPAVEVLGCPAEVTLDWRFPGDGHTAHLVVQWLHKQACRLPEATWVSFSPSVAEADRWLLDKLGQWVSPLEVASLGGRRLHAVGDGGARNLGRDGTVRIASADVALVAPGRPRLLDPSDELPDLARGLHWNIHNNVWGTNFPMWIDGPVRSRFSVDW